MRGFIDDELFKWGFERERIEKEKLTNSNNDNRVDSCQECTSGTYDPNVRKINDRNAKCVTSNVERIYENVGFVGGGESTRFVVYANPNTETRNSKVVKTKKENGDNKDNEENGDNDENSNYENFHEHLILTASSSNPSLLTNGIARTTFSETNTKRGNCSHESKHRKVDERFSLHELYTRCVIGYFKHRHNYVFPAIYEISSLPLSHCQSYRVPIVRDFVDDDHYYRDFDINDDSYEISYDKFVRPIFSTDYEYCSFFLRRLSRDLEVACASLRFRYGKIATIDGSGSSVIVDPEDSTNAPPNYIDPQTRSAPSLKRSDYSLNSPDKFSFSKLRNNFLAQFRKFRDFEDTVAFIRWESAPEIVKTAREKHGERNRAFLTRYKKFIEILERNLNVERTVVPRNGFDETAAISVKPTTSATFWPMSS
ncbi:hypothetical protein KPH14_013114, partial [Odynerus spinipes]